LYLLRIYGPFLPSNFNALFFILSKLFYFLVDPVNWIVIGLLCWLVFRKWKRRKQLGWTIIILFFVFGNSFLHKAIVLAWQPPVSNQLPHQQYKVAVLLGGMTFSNDKKERYFGGTSDRFIQAARLYYTGYAGKLIVTGGDASLRQDRPKEAVFIRQQLMDLQIPDSNIVVESASRNTFENATACKRLLDSLHIAEPVLLVTSATHMRRALACFKKQGVDAVPFASNYEALDNKFSLSALLIPDIVTLISWHSLIKEIVGLQVYKWTGKA
jgi:uncharacterized SAM-binding protein YcdF (DUF218 family)